MAATKQTVGRYHTNDSGKTLPCTAGARPCRFLHGSTPEEAANKWQEVMTDELIPTVAVQDSHGAKLAHYRERSLKEMDDHELAEAIIVEIDELRLNSAKVSEAIALASELHGQQFRKGARGKVERPPYIEHPLRNSLRLLRLGARDERGERIVVASILHDTVEDGAKVFAKKRGATNREAENEHDARKMLEVHIELRFGRDTADIVLAVTNEIPEGDPRTISQEQKHQTYVQHMRNHVLKNPDAFLVKISDFIDNATGLYHGVGKMDPVKLRGQAKKYLLTVPVFEEGLNSLDLPIPAHSVEMLKRGLKETARRLERIIDGWDGIGKI